MENRLMDLIEQLEEILDHATKVPLTGKIMIEEDLILEIVDAMRAAIPEEIRQANMIISDRDRLIEQARSDSQRIIERAQKQAEQLIEEDEIVSQSRAYGEDIVRKAQQYSREVKLGALKYSNDILYGVEQKLEEAYKSIKASREELLTLARRDEKGFQNNEQD